MLPCSRWKSNCPIALLQATRQINHTHPQVTIPVGQTEAKVTVNVGNAEDVYKDPSDVKLSITKAEDSEGREFEKLTVDTAEKTVKVTDTDNEVKVTLVAPADVKGNNYSRVYSKS